MKYFLIAILTGFSYSSMSQDLARFTLRPVENAGIAPVRISLENINYNADHGRIALYAEGPSGYTEVASQVETGQSAGLWFLFDNGAGVTNFVIRTAGYSSGQPATVSLSKSEQAMEISREGNPVLAYNHAEVFPPEGVDMKYRRAAFIHPLWSPGGEVLTHIQPPDHYHHYGIWNPWTKTTVDGREIDFWNLLKGQGTVKFAGYLDAVEGPVYAGFRVHHEHVFFGDQGREKVAINEVWDVRVWETGLKNVTVADLTTTLNTPLPEGIMLNAYRYGGGLGYRATEKWDNTNSTVLTSLGKTRAETDGTNARWCRIEGVSQVDEGRSGILFLSHPSNRMHPEPMRMWPPDANGGVSNVFFEFCPIRHNDWKLEPGNNYTLKYRMVIFDGELTPAEAEKYWKSFAVAPLVSFHHHAVLE